MDYINILENVEVAHSVHNHSLMAGNVAINATILLAIAIGIPALIVGILALFKIKINPRNSMYLYAFTSGLMILLGTVGLIGEGVEHLREYFHGNETAETNHSLNTLIMVAILLSGALLGIGVVFLTRYLVLKKERLEKSISKDQVQLEQINADTCIDGICQHSEAVYNYRDLQKRDARLRRSNKSIAIILMLSHRLVDGISLGSFASFGDLDTIAAFSNWGIIIVFIIHLIPSSIVIYLTQLDIYQSRAKAFLYSLGLLLIFIPFVYIGAFMSYGTIISGDNDKYTYWIMPLLFTLSGTILLLMSILELIPEFIDNRNMTKKQWTITTLCLMAGILLAIGLLAIHSHPEHPEDIGGGHHHHHYLATLII